MVVTVPNPNFREKRSAGPADVWAGYDSDYDKVINMGDLHYFREIPTEGSRANNVVGQDDVYD